MQKYQKTKKNGCPNIFERKLLELENHCSVSNTNSCFLLYCALRCFRFPYKIKCGIPTRESVSGIPTTKSVSGIPTRESVSYIPTRGSVQISLLEKVFQYLC
jgi:hypothetical protein